MGMYFPREAAAWSLGVSVTWLQPCLLSVNLLASWSSSLAIKGWDCCLAWPWALSTGCWVPIPCLPSAPKHLEMLYHPKRAWPQVGCEARNPHRGKAGGAQVTWEGEECEGIPALRPPSLHLLLPLLFCWANQAGSNGTLCFKGPLPSTSLLFV